METPSDSRAPSGATTVKDELVPPHLPETPVINEEPSTKSQIQQPIKSEQENPLTEQSIRRMLEELLDKKLGAGTMMQQNKRRLRSEEIRSKLTTEAMNALACNQSSQFQQLLTPSTTSTNSSQPGPSGERSSENTERMRKRLHEIETSLPPIVSSRVGLKLSEAIDWKEDATSPPLPPLPKFMGKTGEQEFWSMEKAKFSSHSYSKDLSLSLREKLLQALSSELAVYVSSTEDFVTTLTRIALTSESIILSEIYQWREISRNEEFKMIRFYHHGYKRNQKINAIQYYIKFRGRELTRAILTLKDAILASNNTPWEANQVDFTTGLKLALKRAWWILNLHKGVSRKVALEEQVF